MGQRGRPRKADKYGGHILAAENLIADRLPDLLENLFRLAEGVEVQKADANGNPRVYSQPPDRQANEYLLNRIMGKPTERVEQESRSVIVERRDRVAGKPAPPAGGGSGGREPV